MRIWKTSTRFFALSILLLVSTLQTPNVAATYQPSPVQKQKQIQHQQPQAQPKQKQQVTKQQQAALQEQVEQVHQRKLEDNLRSYTHLSHDTVRFILQEAKRKDVPASIVFGLMEQESTFRTDAVNPSSGATGLGQIEHTTADHLATQVGSGDLHDPIYNSRLAIFYLQYLHTETGDWNATLTAYNRGLGGLYEYQHHNGTASSDYSRSVLHRSQNIRTLTGAS